MMMLVKTKVGVLSTLRMLMATMIMFGGMLAVSPGSPPNASDLVRLAVPSLAKLEAAYRRVSGTGVFSIHNSTANIDRVHNVQFALTDGNELLIESVSRYTGSNAERTLGWTFVKVATPFQSFRLQRAPGREEYLTEFISKGPDAAAAAAIKESMRGSIQLLSAPYQFMGWIPLSKVVTHDAFSANSITDISGADWPSIRVSFQVQASSNKQDPLYVWRDSGPISGWFEVYPEHSFALRAFEIQMREPDAVQATQIGRLHYDRVEDGVPVLQRAERELKYGHRQMFTQSLELRSLAFGATDADRFTPAAFGLTADIPALQVQSHNLLWLWITIGVLLIIAVALRYAARRKVEA